MVLSGICGGWRGCGSFFGSGRGERWMERWGLGWRLFHYRLSRLVEREGPVVGDADWGQLLSATSLSE